MTVILRVNRKREKLEKPRFIKKGHKNEKIYIVGKVNFIPKAVQRVGIAKSGVFPPSDHPICENICDSSGNTRYNEPV